MELIDSVKRKSNVECFTSEFQLPILNINRQEKETSRKRIFAIDEGGDSRMAGGERERREETTSSRGVLHVSL